MRSPSSSVALSMVPILSWGREVLALVLKTFDFVFVCRFLILERGGVQKTRSVDYPQNGNCFSPEAKHGSVPAIKQLPVSCPQNVILGYERTSFRKAF